MPLPKIESPGARMARLQGELREALLAGQDTAEIHAKIARAQADEAAVHEAAALAARVDRDAAKEAIAAAAALRVQASQAALSGRLAALAPPPFPQF